ncbi:MAG: hypothetical protein AAF125_22600 [Chloroflexota bacterium]
MPYYVEWDDTDQSVARLEFSGRWTWDEWYLGHDALRHLMDEATHPDRVDIIECFYQPMPRGNAIPAFKYGGSSQASNARHTVFVNEAGVMFRKMVDGVVNVMGWQGPHFCGSIDEARSYLTKKAELEP